MRLWHVELLPKLPSKQLCGQWREVVALLGNGWGKKHSTVDYVFRHSDFKLLLYSHLVYLEMINRGYKPNYSKLGKAMSKRHNSNVVRVKLRFVRHIYLNFNKIIFPEHNNSYLQECIENLRKKGVEIA